MKKYSLLLLLIPSLAFSQLRLPYAYLLQNYHGDTSKVTFSGDLLKWHISKDTLDIDVPIKSQGHLLGAGSGSTIYANNGLYKDGDTIKSKQRILKDFYTFATTSGTSEQDLFSYTIPANTFFENGDKIIFSFMLGGTGTPTGKIYFAGTSVDLTIADSQNYFFTVYLIRTSSSVCLMTITATSINSYEPMQVPFNSTNFATTNILKITGQSITTGATTSNFGYIEFKPAAQ